MKDFKDFLTEALVTAIVGFVMFTGPILGLLYIPSEEYHALAGIGKGFCWGLLTITAGEVFGAIRRLQ